MFNNVDLSTVLRQVNLEVNQAGDMETAAAEVSSPTDSHVTCSMATCFKC